MKKILTFLLALFLGGNLCAQKLELDELTSPSTPAFTLLGLSPTTINRPTLGTPFLMSLANGLNGKSIASDVAIETTPYWWVPRHGLTYKEYYGLDKTGKSSVGFMDQIAQSFALSVATSDASPDIDSIDSRFLAIGIRFQVLKGEPSKEFTNAYEGSLSDQLLIREAIAELGLRVSKGKIATLDQLKENATIIVQSLLSFDKELINRSQQSKDKRSKLATEYIDNLLQTVEKSPFQKETIAIFLETERLNVSDKVNDMLIEMHGMSRVGWLLEFSGAASLLAPTNNIEYTLGEDWAGWGTLTYRMEPKEGSKKNNDFNLMARFGGNFQQSNSYNSDLGLSWVLIGDNYSVTLEGIFRSYRTYMDITATDGQIYNVSETDNTSRFALAYQYKFSDNISVSLTAGKDFENSRISMGGMFSLVNLNFSLPGKKTILVN
ncbi:MAG: hypothetical protein V1775_12375 [Bacteroidota bacterium]